MFTGILFSSNDPDLDAHVRELDERVALLFPGFADGRASAHLRLVRNEFSGRGVSLAPGYLPPAGEALAFYFGRVVADGPSGEFVLDLPPLRVGRRAWHPSIDAAAICRSRFPPAGNAALFNHTCHGATVVLRQPDELRSCRLPCVAAYPTAELQPGGPLLWDYDGGARRGNGAFSVDLARSLELRAEGIDSVRCACRGALPCPRNRWFRAFDS
jgi:hypothetical protein